jgi:lysyl-tRNA synthetase class 2
VSQYESKFEEKLYTERREKLAQIAAIARSLNPALTDAEARYPNTFAFTSTVPELRAIGENGDLDPLSTEDLADMHIEAAIAGRIMAIRVQGKAGFAQLQQHGQRLQIYVRKDDVGEALFNLYKLLDLGDHVGVRGFLMRTRTGELTLHAAPITLPGHEGQPALTLLTKAMLALPDKYHGLEDVELRYRQRYVDLIVNSGYSTKEGVAVEKVASYANANPDAPVPDIEHFGINVREVFVKRAHILRSIRHFFDTRGYLEVETPMLHTISGGAAARPFETHHNALDIPLKLRIAPELYLKRLVVGGFDRVYEINRNFRNEGVSTQHNPEFTMLEFYQAYANYHDLMDLTQELITHVAQEVNGTTLTTFNGTEIDLSKWTKLSMREAIIKFWPKSLRRQISEDDLKDDESAQAFVESVEEELNHGVFPGIRMEIDGVRVTDLITAVTQLWSSMGLGKATANLFELLAEPHLIQPTIIYDFPLTVSPLSKVKPNEPDWVERFEFYIGGFELGNAFSELNDPDDQRARFEAQLAEKARGDDEAMPMDEDYVRALGYGLPPTAGEGIGIDRLTMILTGSRSIRDVILFPLMRPQKPTAETTPEAQPHGESAE